eukprot:5039858-Amphidinium_carterae.1
MKLLLWVTEGAQDVFAPEFLGVDLNSFANRFTKSASDDDFKKLLLWVTEGAQDVFAPEFL